jgi:predicted dehydrogenase
LALPVCTRKSWTRRKRLPAPETRRNGPAAPRSGGNGGAKASPAPNVPPPGQTPLAPPKPGTDGGNAKTPATPEKRNVAPVTIAVVGLGEQGRRHLTSLGYVPGANVRYVCDAYEPSHRRASEMAPKAEAITDYRRALDDKSVQAIYVCTPSHQHRQIVQDALQAGKHVYCEAPLASSMDDARAIARAARAQDGKLIFHSGLQQRTNPQHNHVLGFVRTGALAKLANMRAEWNKKDSWRRTAATPEREQALNWRLRRESSGGLMGEIGIHQVDVPNWYLKAAPVLGGGLWQHSAVA